VCTFVVAQNWHSYCIYYCQMLAVASWGYGWGVALASLDPSPAPAALSVLLVLEAGGLSASIAATTAGTAALASCRNDTTCPKRNQLVFQFHFRLTWACLGK
jgi:hypothetical protein